MFANFFFRSDKSRWIDALSPVTKETDNEKIYEEWDCPQVQCTRKYISTEPDELSLEESDVVNVFKKMADGWYEGERIRDGERGWFPANCTEEIVNSHVRARNLRLRYRLLAASEEYSSYNNMTSKA
ncbi:neuronal guanine nucleotide exchange factor [Mytilus galloprovincialis]|uniref:Neuronal guanine nucleotide exchange factor n=1 Tax=Mytilus galloprovincialis TaxID=29158 RepID=A0A8B6GGD6_MYTGA|nr:neuronal guanine nucleotide exchange factor [Mytilus galloprovincialis]